MNQSNVIKGRSHFGYFALYIFCLLIPSLATVQKFLGEWGVVGYLVIAPVSIWALLRFGVPTFQRACSIRHAWILLAVLVVFIVAAFVVLYPYAQNRGPDGGSDSDDALNLAAGEMLRGHYPYHQRTYLDNPISPMPGAVLLAMPFYLLGSAAYQNVFWLLVYLIVSISLLGDIRVAFVHLAGLTLLAPVVMHTFVTGMDLFANPIYVLVFFYFVVTRDLRQRPVAGVTAAVLLGLAISSRMNFAFILPLVAASLVRRYEWKTALLQTCIVAASFAAITLPYYLYDPAGFSPLHTVNKLKEFNRYLPNSEYLALGLMSMAAVLLSFQKRLLDEAVVFRNISFVQMAPVITCVVIALVAAGKVEYSFLYYGMFFLFFGSLAAVARMYRPASAAN